MGHVFRKIDNEVKSFVLGKPVFPPLFSVFSFCGVTLWGIWKQTLKASFPICYCMMFRCLRDERVTAVDECVEFFYDTLWRCCRAKLFKLSRTQRENSCKNFCQCCFWVLCRGFDSLIGVSKDFFFLLCSYYYNYFNFFFWPNNIFWSNILLIYSIIYVYYILIIINQFMLKKIVYFDLNLCNRQSIWLHR